jgi:hypothetical protein
LTLIILCTCKNESTGDPHLCEQRPTRDARAKEARGQTRGAEVARGRHDSLGTGFEGTKSKIEGQETVGATLKTDSIRREQKI